MPREHCVFAVYKSTFLIWKVNVMCQKCWHRAYCLGIRRGQYIYQRPNKNIFSIFSSSHAHALPSPSSLSALRGQIDHITRTHSSFYLLRARGLPSNGVYHSSTRHVTSHGALHERGHLSGVAGERQWGEKKKGKREERRRGESLRWLSWLIVHCPGTLAQLTAH